MKNLFLTTLILLLSNPIYPQEVPDYMTPFSKDLCRCWNFIPNDYRGKTLEESLQRCWEQAFKKYESEVRLYNDLGENIKTYDPSLNPECYFGGDDNECFHYEVEQYVIYNCEDLFYSIKERLENPNAEIPDIRFSSARINLNAKDKSGKKGVEVTVFFEYNIDIGKTYTLQFAFGSGNDRLRPKGNSDYYKFMTHRYTNKNGDLVIDELFDTFRDKSLDGLIVDAGGGQNNSKSKLSTNYVMVFVPNELFDWSLPKGSNEVWVNFALYDGGGNDIKLIKVVGSEEFNYVKR